MWMLKAVDADGCGGYGLWSLKDVTAERCGGCVLWRPRVVQTGCRYFRSYHTSLTLAVKISKDSEYSL